MSQKSLWGGGKIMKINELRLGAIPLSPDILGKANIGLWAFELDEGQEPRMYVDDTMLGLVGLDHQVPPEETYHAWYDNIDNDSYDLVADAVAKMVSGEHAEVQYPWHHPDGHTMIVRCGGVRNPEYKRGIRIEGTHQNVTAVVHFDEEERRRNKQRERDLIKAKFRADMLSYIADHDGSVDDFLDYFGDRILQIAACDQVIFRNLNGKRTVRNAPGISDVAVEICARCPFCDATRDIYSEGLVVMENCRKGFNGVLPMTGCQAKSSVMQQIYCNGKLAGLLSFHYLKERHDFSEEELSLLKLLAQYLGLFLGSIEARRLEKLTNEQYLNNFIKDYNIALRVDSTTDSFEVLKLDDGISELPRRGDSFKELVSIFLETIVYDADKESVAVKLVPEAIQRRLSGSSACSIEYRVLVGGKVAWNEMVLTALDADTIGIGISIKDKDIVLNHLKDKSLEDYFALVSVDFDSKLLTVRARSPYYPMGNVGEAIPYTLAMSKFAMTQDAEVRDFFLKISDFDYLKKAFAVEDKLSYSYKSRNVEGDKWVTITSYVIARHEDGSPAVLTIGFSALDTMGSDRQEMQRQIADALELAQSANIAKTSFLNNMSHDIRTPMNAIIGYTSMARKSVDDKERVAEYLRKISIAGNNLLNLVNQVLDMSRIESGKVVLTEEPLDILDKSQEMVEIFKPSAQEKSITFHSDFHGISNRAVYADSGRINQLVMNILGNAIKYTPEGGRIDFSVTQTECGRPGYGSFVIVVQDSGIGISKEYLEHIFEPFSRESTSTVSKIQGTGLGMSIVKKLVDLMGGTIGIESEFGKGTRITVSLEFRLQDETEESKDEKNDRIIDTDLLNGRRTLLVEDNEMNREIATMILEEYGIIVETAEDGDIAVEKMQAVADRGDWGYYDFVLMDVQMPRMNGYDATRAIRAIPAPSDIHMPIIAMTANAFAEDRQLAIDAGMDDHIAKPIDVRTLWETLAKFV